MTRQLRAHHFETPTVAKYIHLYIHTHTYILNNIIYMYYVYKIFYNVKLA